MVYVTMKSKVKDGRNYCNITDKSPDIWLCIGGIIAHDPPSQLNVFNL